MSKKFAWTKHKSDEIWRGGPCDSVKECVEEARAEGYSDEELFAIGYTERYEPNYVNSDMIIEYLQQDACDNVGEVAEDWLSDITHEQRAELESRVLKVVQEWLEYCGEKPTFYKVLPFDELTLKEALEKYKDDENVKGGNEK